MLHFQSAILIIKDESKEHNLDRKLVKRNKLRGQREIPLKSPLSLYIFSSYCYDTRYLLYRYILKDRNKE